jgi:glyoxylase-like metal-dependent hydrolase (beta-lactamase superfamily II)
MKIAKKWFQQYRIDDRITLIKEPHVSEFAQCNIWHVKGRDADLLIDGGMGISSLKEAINNLIDKPLIAVTTHTHFDHIGSIHEFEQRLVHPLESHSLSKPDDFPVLCSCHWPKGMRESINQQGYEVPDLLIDAYPHEGFDPEYFRIKGCDATRLIDEGDVIDLGDCVFEIMHLPGHSPGGIGLWNAKDRVLFSGDTIYDGPLLNKIEGANLEDYEKSLNRIKTLPVSIVHGGHDPSFGRDRLMKLINQYMDENT